MPVLRGTVSSPRCEIFCFPSIPFSSLLDPFMTVSSVLLISSLPMYRLLNTFFKDPSREEKGIEGKQKVRSR